MKTITISSRFAGVLLFLFGVSSCNFSESSSFSINDGITTRGKNLSCENVYLTIARKETNRKSYVYGEKVEVHLTGISGFVRKNEKLHPGMEITVTDAKGKTVLHNQDLYLGTTTNLPEDALDLYAILSIGDPMQEGGNYEIKLHVWDKNGAGTFDLSFHFTVRKDENIVSKTSNNVKFGRVYLYDQAGDSAITTGTLRTNQRAYLVIEGLKGFNEQNGKCSIGMKLNISDGNNVTLLESEDLIGDEPLSAKDIQDRVFATFILREKGYTNPIQVNLKVYDKRSDATFETRMELKMDEQMNP